MYITVFYEHGDTNKIDKELRITEEIFDFKTFTVEMLNEQTFKLTCIAYIYEKTDSYKS